MSRTLTAGEESALAYANELVTTGQKLATLTSHPGKTSEFTQWKEKIITFVSRIYGADSVFTKRLTDVSFFPNWYRDQDHGPQTGNRVYSDAAVSDRNTAFNMYKDGVYAYVAIINSIADDIRVNGTPKVSDEKTSLVPSVSTTINPVFSQSQGQSQSQEQSQTVEQNIENAIREIEEHYGEEHAEKAKELLGQLKTEPKKWSHAQKVLTYAANLGRDAFLAVLPVLTQILITGHHN